MADLRSVVVIGDGPVKDGPALHGADIGYIYGGYNVQLTVDYASLHDGWVAITNPPTWKDTGKQGFVKWSRCQEESGAEEHYLVTIYNDGRAPLVRQVK